MLKKERQAYILHQVSLHNSVLSADLSTLINVSEDTIRRDLNELADTGKVIKVHGGAISKSFNSFYLRSDVYNADSKKVIAEKAVSLIKDGMFILSGGGTTIIEMARLLPEHLKATFLTGSIPAAYEYAQHPNIEVIFIGDKNAAKAGAGKYNPALLEKLLQHDFFSSGFPKTTGPELFNLDYLTKAKQAADINEISHEDTMATLNRFSAVTITEAMKRTLAPGVLYTIYTSGGGMHNPLLMDTIRTMLPEYPFYTTDVLEINPDAKEAVLFAILANETVAGGQTVIGNGSTDIPSVSMGKISFPG